MTTTIRDPSSNLSQDGSSAIMTSRRDKRRHVSTNADVVDLRDPFSVIALAVRYDEASGDTDASLLKVPLERGGIYNHKTFGKALQYLQKNTVPPRHFSRDGTTRKGTTTTNVALSPIILSGLLAIGQQQEEEDVAVENGYPTSTELVNYCQNMRRAASARVKVRNQRRRIQKTVTPILVVVGSIVLYGFTMSNFRSLLVDSGFVDSCGGAGGDGVYQQACRLAEASLWQLLYPSYPQMVDCTLKECVLQEGIEKYPLYALHSSVREEWIPMEQVGEGRRRKRNILRVPPSPPTSLQWLGETTVNRLVREALEEHQTTTTATATATTGALVKVLDVGCGVGGTLYALLPSTPHKLSYHGISISAPEIHQAQRLASMHQLLPDTTTTTAMDIQFTQHNFDDPLKDTFTSMIAIDSLSFSQNIQGTLTNLVSSLQRGGTMVIVTDVVAPWAEPTAIDLLVNVTAKTSLLTHAEWNQQLESHGLIIHQVRDLGLEFDLHILQAQSPWVKTVREWRRRPAQIILQKWQAWLGTGATMMKQKASARIVQLLLDLVQRAWGKSLRQEAYQRADLSFYMYTCVKK
jgi:cyclopropane fatty-acyl-phospholipid synthase-like methyltransferase